MHVCIDKHCCLRRIHLTGRRLIPAVAHPVHSLIPYTHSSRTLTHPVHSLKPSAHSTWSLTRAIRSFILLARLLTKLCRRYLALFQQKNQPSLTVDESCVHRLAVSSLVHRVLCHCWLGARLRRGYPRPATCHRLSIQV